MYYIIHNCKAKKKIETTKFLNEKKSKKIHAVTFMVCLELKNDIQIFRTKFLTKSRQRLDDTIMLSA